jgi:hypothetical protein
LISIQFFFQWKAAAEEIGQKFIFFLSELKFDHGTLTKVEGLNTVDLLVKIACFVSRK